jgi:hypothetical protein
MMEKTLSPFFFSYRWFESSRKMSEPPPKNTLRPTIYIA